MPSPIHFSGSFTSKEYQLLKEYIDNRKAEMAGIKLWAYAELSSNGSMILERDPVTNKPSKLIITPPNSKLYQLVEHYVRNGGNPLDLDIAPIYSPKIPKEYTQGDADNPPMLINNDGSEKDTRVHNDTYAAVAVYNLKEFFLPSIKSKFSKWEYKIIKAVDYSDKLISTINKIDTLLKEESTPGSILDLMSKVEIIMNDPAFPRAGSDLSGMTAGGIGQNTDEGVA